MPSARESDMDTKDLRALDFRSDNVAGMAPEVLAALVAANAGSDSAYGEDAVTARLQAKLADLFGHEVKEKSSAEDLLINQSFFYILVIRTGFNVKVFPGGRR